MSKVIEKSTVKEMGDTVKDVEDRVWHDARDVAVGTMGVPADRHGESGLQRVLWHQRWGFLYF